METIIINQITFNKLQVEFHKQMTEVYHCLELLEDEYPNFKEWYFNKVIIGIIKGNRSLILKKVRDEIVAISILKNDMDEKKISTFRVIEKYQQLGIGSLLMEESMRVLGTITPKITVSEIRYHQFVNILKKYDFKLIESVPNYYNENIIEYSFNGLIEDNIEQAKNKTYIQPSSYQLSSYLHKVINRNVII